MIYYDVGGYFPVDKTGDGGDSAVRASILSISHSREGDMFRPLHYVINDGECVRHPSQSPWNNPKNCSRDQMVMLLAGLSVANYSHVVRGIFKKTVKRLFFAQNIEHDEVGTKKKLPNWADPLMPNHIGMMIIAGRIWWMYWFLPVAYLFHVVFLFFPSKEENQAIAESYVYRDLWLYRTIRPKWHERSYYYWNSRGEIEYHLMLREMVG